MSMADRQEQVSCVNNRNHVQSAFFRWFNLNNQMLVLRPSMIDFIIHFDSPSPSLSSFMDSFQKLCKIQDAGTKCIQCGPLDGHATCSPVPIVYENNCIAVDS